MKRFISDLSHTVKVVVFCIFTFALFGGLVALCTLDQPQEEEVRVQEVTLIDAGNYQTGSSDAPLFTKNKRESVTAVLVVATQPSETGGEDDNVSTIVKDGSSSDEDSSLDQSDVDFKSQKPHSYDIEQGDTISFELKTSAARECDAFLRDLNALGEGVTGGSGSGSGSSAPGNMISLDKNGNMFFENNGISPAKTSDDGASLLSEVENETILSLADHALLEYIVAYNSTEEQIINKSSKAPTYVEQQASAFSDEIPQKALPEQQSNEVPQPDDYDVICDEGFFGKDDNDR